MAVQQNKKSRSRKGMRRSHDHVAVPNYTLCTNCNKEIMPHRVCPSCGFYDGHMAVQPHEKKEKKAQDENE